MTHQVLTDKQYGFRPNYSCQTQLLNDVEEIHLAMNCSPSVDLIFLDFHKAFDNGLDPHLFKNYATTE